MIRDAVLHLLNEQPLVADLHAPPAPGDLVLICTNLRTLNRKRPIFADDSASTFVIPYAQLRFVEIPSELGPAGEAAPLAVTAGEPEDLVLDEDFLRRVREL